MYKIFLHIAIFIVFFPVVISANEGKPFATQYYRSITIDHTKVPNTTQTDFPVLISVTGAYLKTVANGGKVQNANGYDILFSSDAAGTTLLNWEVEKYDATTGELIAWVKTDLSPSTDKVIYLRYGDNTITSFQGNATATWNSGFAAVWHMKGSSLSASDATSNANNATISNATAVTGNTGTAAGFNGSNAYLSVPYSSTLNCTSGLTVSAWINTTTANRVVMGKPFAATNSSPYFDWSMYLAGGPKIEFRIGSTTTVSTSNVPSGWQHVVLTADGSNMKIYLNGVLDKTLATSALPTNTNSQGVKIGANAVNGQVFNGSQDEIEISSVARSADWIATQFNNLSFPSTFYAVGNEIASGNQPPTANAGADQTITLPTTQVTLNGTGTANNGGSIVSYSWALLPGGTAGGTISSPGLAQTEVTGLGAGTNIYRLTVTDNDLGTHTDDVTITVNASSGLLPISQGGTGQSSFGAGYLKSNGTILSSVATIPEADIAGIVPVAKGGTGVTNASDALNVLLPSQSGQSGKVLSTNGASASWVTPGSGSKWIDASGNHIYNYNSGNVGIGTNTPAYKLDVINSGRIGNIILSQGEFNTIETGIASAFRIRNNNGPVWLEAGSGSAVVVHKKLIVNDDGLPLQHILMDGKSIRTINGYGLNWGLTIGADGTDVIKLFTNGNMVVGSNSFTDAGYKLDVVGNIRSSTGLHTSGSVRLGGLATDNTQTKVLVTDVNGNVYNRDISTISSTGSSYWTASPNGTDIFNQNTGNIGIGTTPQSAYKLAVNGVIGARKVKVTAESWADFVFDPGYKLPTLKEVEAFIAKHRHLPDLPSAQEVEANGIDLGKNQAVLLQKIEELTLYLIEQNKKIEAQGSLIVELKSELKMLQSELNNHK